MNLIDAIILFIVAVGFILGFKDGFVRKLIGLIGLALAIYLTATYYEKLGKMFQDVLGMEEYLSNIVGGFAVFIVIILIFSIIKRVIHPFDKVNNFINQILGGTIGIIQILFFLSALIYILNIFDVPDKDSARESVFYTDVYRIIPASINFINDFQPGSKDFIRDFINDKDTLR